ncbi:MAG: hypothetical protein AABW49_05015 [Nanoarchaeota archaeon]
MEHLKRIKSSEVKKIINSLKEQYGIKKLKLPFIFFKNSKDYIFIVSKAWDTVNIKDIRVNNIGLYFANVKTNAIRLTIEGSQLLGPMIKKNIVDVSKDEISDWIRGESLNKKISSNCFVVIRNNNDYFGCGRKHDDMIANFIPKSRKIKSYNLPKISPS